MPHATRAISALLVVLTLALCDAASGRAHIKPQAPTLRLRGGAMPTMEAATKWFTNMPCFGQREGGPKIIIAGAPASGKGTQCEFIVKKFGVVHISTGDALREQVSAGTELGKLAKEYMDKGALVPDDVIIGIVKDRLKSSDCKQKGWLLDGFPRTGVQAEAMAKAGIVADKCIFLDVPDEKLIERCEGRRTDPKTGAIYHLKFNPPPNDTEVKKRLVHRSDDTKAAMVKRLEQFHKNVVAIESYYKDISVKIDGQQDKMKIAAEIEAYISEGC